VTVSKVEFHEKAESEMLRAANFYFSQEPGLEQRFLDEVEAGLVSIASHPNSWPIIEGDVRKKVLVRFPFLILYRPEPARIYILAVMHQSRNADWKNRLA